MKIGKVDVEIGLQKLTRNKKEKLMQATHIPCAACMWRVLN